MKKIIVSDTSPLIALAKLDHLDLLLDVFSEIHIPKAVYQEATCDRYRADSLLIHHFIEQHVLLHHHDCNNKNYKIFNAILDEGESQALSLAIELKCGILIDERLGRRVANEYDISCIGIMGILLQAKYKGLIPAVKPLIEQLQQKKYRVSDKLIELVLQKAAEL